MEISIDTTKSEQANIQSIARRAKDHFGDDPLQVEMDITACHCNGCRLRLAELLMADDFNFAHDLYGIRRHLNRQTGQLEDRFAPQFASRKAE